MRAAVAYLMDMFEKQASVYKEAVGIRELARDMPLDKLRDFVRRATRGRINIYKSLADQKLPKRQFDLEEKVPSYRIVDPGYEAARKQREKELKRWRKEMKAAIAKAKSPKQRLKIIKKFRKNRPGKRMAQQQAGLFGPAQSTGKEVFVRNEKDQRNLNDAMLSALTRADEYDSPRMRALQVLQNPSFSKNQNTKYSIPSSSAIDFEQFPRLAGAPIQMTAEGVPHPGYIRRMNRIKQEAMASGNAEKAFLKQVMTRGHRPRDFVDYTAAQRLGNQPGPGLHLPSVPTHYPAPIGKPMLMRSHPNKSFFRGDSPQAVAGGVEQSAVMGRRRGGDTNKFVTPHFDVSAGYSSAGAARGTKPDDVVVNPRASASQSRGFMADIVDQAIRDAPPSRQFTRGLATPLVRRFDVEDARWIAAKKKGVPVWTPHIASTSPAEIRKAQGTKVRKAGRNIWGDRTDYEGVIKKIPKEHTGIFRPLDINKRIGQEVEITDPPDYITDSVQSQIDKWQELPPGMEWT